MYPVSIYTLGCKLNQLESEAIADSFTQSGFTVFPWGQAVAGPGILIINTCTVTSKADQKSRRLIRKALRDHPESCVIVIGCYAQLDSDEIQSLEAELVSAPDVRESHQRLFAVKGREGGAGTAKSALLDLPEYIREYCFPGASLPRAVEVWLARARGKSPFSFAPEEFAFHSRGYLKIQDGCDNCCAYCRVRLARGPSVSVPHEAALAELRACEAVACAELTITGVNITQYSHMGMDLAALLEYLLNGTSVIALRLASLEPEGITARLAAVLAHPRIRPHFHLSAQSGSDTVLRRMNRLYDAKRVAEGAALLRSVKDNPFLACDIIAGFPGETESEFEQTLALCEHIRFAWIHAFPYSARPGTAAFSFTGSTGERAITPLAIPHRIKTLTGMALRGRRDYAQSWLGRELSAVVEKGKPVESGLSGNTGSPYRAVSENYLKLLVNGEPDSIPGRSIRCVPMSLCENADGENPDAIAVKV